MRQIIESVLGVSMYGDAPTLEGVFRESFNDEVLIETSLQTAFSSDSTLAWKIAFSLMDNLQSRYMGSGDVLVNQ